MSKHKLRAITIGSIVACFLSTMLCAQINSVSSTAEEKSSFGNPNVSSVKSLRIGIVNSKKCLENSKLGKQEQANLDKMQEQMESILHDKNDALEEIKAKLEDEDYMDSVSEEVASQLRRKQRMIEKEGAQLQSQYMRTLQQAHVKNLQKVTDAINKASGLVAKEANSPIDVIFTDEACTFFAPQLDVTEQVIAQMNILFDAEQKETHSKSR